jgi:6-phosphogluconolactonase (cycloisomerase 2 family)
MTMKVRALLVGIVLLVEMWLGGCGHYSCKETFGASSCSAGQGGITQGGGGGTTGGLYVLIADAGGIQGEVVDPTAKTIVNDPPYHGQNVPVDTGVPGDWMVIAAGKFMYTGYTATGQIYGWSLNGDGSLTDLTSINGGQILTAAYLLNASGGLQYMITNPQGTVLFVADSTNDQVHVYTIGATDGGLTEVLPAAQLPTGFGPFNLAVDGLGKYLYVSNGAGFSTTEVAQFSIGSTGALTAIGSPISSNLQQMQGDPSGKFMIGTNGSIFSLGGSLYVTSIQSTGALGTPTLVATTGQPINVIVQQSTGGNLVYVIDLPVGTGQTNGAIEGFTLDSSAGTLTAISGMGTQNGFEGHFDQTGQYLFVSSNPNQAHVGLNVWDTKADSTLTTALTGGAWSQGAWMPFNAQ